MTDAATQAGARGEALREGVRVLCAAPAWNEGARIADVVQAVPEAWVDEVVVVDDGSTDDTAEHARAAGATVLRHEQNRGVGAAIRSAVEYGQQHGFDVVVIVSGGGKTPPHQLPALLRPIVEGEADFVQGSRYAPGGSLRGAPLHRRIGTVGYTALFVALSRRWVSDASSGFRAFRLSALERLDADLKQSWLDRYELEPYLLFKARRGRARYAEVAVTIDYPPRGEGYTKMQGIADWWRIFRPVVFLALKLRR
jgi:dolichol-phosphate mannosyltransferase